MITIEHEVSNPRNRAMMIPMGVYKNIHIADIKEGDFLKTRGKDGVCYCCGAHKDNTNRTSIP